MSVVLFASATNSPGVTTTCLGLALAWPRAVVLVDADRDAGRAVLSGYLIRSDAAGRAIHQLMQPYRQGVGLRAGLAHNLIPLRGNAVAGAANATATLWVKKAKHTNVVEHPASFLPGFTHPAAASVFEPVWASLGIELNALDADGVDVLVDCGRIGIGLPAGLLDVATLVLLVGRSSLRSLAGLEAQLKSVTAARTAAEVGLLLVGPGRPYSVAEINKQFAVPVMATLPWSSDEAAVLSDGIFRFRHRRDTALGQAFIAVAAAIQKQARQRRELLHSETSEVTP